MRNPDFEGHLSINGKAWSDDFARSTAYMHQSEHFLVELTPREHLLFQAELRLPSGTPAVEREAAANRVISELGLEKCMNTLIGNPLEGRGLSRCGLRSVSSSCIFIQAPVSDVVKSIAQTHHLAFSRMMNAIHSLEDWAQE